MNEKKKIPKRTAILLMILTGLIIVLFGGDFIYEIISPRFSQTANVKNCNVAFIPINGFLGSYDGQIVEGEVVGSSSDNIVRDLLLAEKNPQIKAILVSIDSVGGSIFAGEEIANTLKSLTKPNVAVIRGAGLSSAYWASTGADTIFASPRSSVGDIGVTASYLDQTAKDAKEGYKYIEITSTPYKDVGNPHRPLSKEEMEGWIASVKQDHDIFVEEVAENRNLSVEDVANIADGTSMGGMDAMDYGLIDGIGDIVFTINYISSKIGEKAKICW